MGFFPTQFKHAEIKMIPKHDKDPTQPINYRPISLLEIPGKVYEQSLNNRLRQYTEFNNLLPTHQHGFRANRGTDTVLGHIMAKISHSLSNRDKYYIVLRDVQKLSIKSGIMVYDLS